MGIFKQGDVQSMNDMKIKGQENPVRGMQYGYMRAAVWIRQAGNPVRIHDNNETLDKLCRERLSIARFGDGEMNIMRGNSIDFQRYNKILADRLEEILGGGQDRCLIGIPPVLKRMRGFRVQARRYWVENLFDNYEWWEKSLESRDYYSANITRPYIDYEDRKKSGAWFSKMKRLWDGRKVLIVEGTGTRFGVGNDLLANAQEVKRIICPAKNAFAVYRNILECALEFDKSYLILAALGPTATVLAYEMADHGYQAVDIGHCDIEYEWFLKKARYKEIVEGKYTNEVRGGNRIEGCQNEEYLNQIVAKTGSQEG